MSISVSEVLAGSGLEHAGVVAWGREIPLDVPGVYVVSSSSDVHDAVGSIRQYTPNAAAFAELRLLCPYVTLDGEPAGDEELATRIGRFWIPDSAILYIGLAGTSVRKRMNQYYRTSIGQRAPHAGGWWLKTLANLDDLYVHIAAADEPKVAEAEMLRRFAEAVPTAVRQNLHDSERIAPFANVDVQQGLRKRHGLSGHKVGSKRAGKPLTPTSGLKNSVRQTDSVSFPVEEPLTFLGARQAGTRVQSQVITDGDRTRSNLRIPARSKFAFPAENCVVTVHYEGQMLECLWRVNGSRSGTIGLGRDIMREIGRPNQPVWLEVAGSSVTIDT